MKQLTKLKKTGELRRCTHLRLILRNNTKWSSAFQLKQRYIELLPHIDKKDQEPVSVLSSAIENLELEILLNKQSWKLTKMKQCGNITLSKVRVLFDGLIADYLDMEHHLDRNANIIHSKTFENTIIRIQTGGDFLLSAEEKEILASFQRISEYEVVEATELDTDYAEILLAAKTQAKSHNLNRVPATSNRAEKSFSRTRLTLNFNRSTMIQAHVESVLFSIGAF